MKGAAHIYHPEVVKRSQEKLEQTLGWKLQRHTPEEVEEFLFSLRGVGWDETGAPSRLLTEEEIQFITNEIYLCRIDFRYWMRRYCNILTADKQIAPMHSIWPSQEKVLQAIAEKEYEDLILKGRDRTSIKIILLKARQIGGTIISEALAAHMTFLNKNTQSIIASDHPDNTTKLWQVLTRIWEKLPGWMQPHRDAKVKATHLHLDRTNSDVIFGSGNQKTTLGQGQNVDFVHITEVSTWDAENWYRLDADLMPAFDSSEKHHKLFIAESTGSGMDGNWFYELFQAAQAGDSEFIPLFISWFYRPGWSKPYEGQEFLPETLQMAQRVKNESGVDLSKEQMIWYQDKKKEAKAKNQLETFFQEFPSTVEEAFQSGFRPAIPIEILSKLRDTVRVPLKVYEVDAVRRKMSDVSLKEWREKPGSAKANGKLIIWEAPRAGFTYVVGVDASYGMDGKDSAAVEVLRVGNKTHPDEQVAEWRGQISPLDLAGVAEIAGKIYKDPIEQFEAKVVIEVNPGSPGIVTQTEMIRRGWPHFYIWKRPTRLGGGWTKEIGWWTTPSTRPLMTEMGVDYIKKNHLWINSPFLIEELGSFVDTGDPARGQRHLEHAPGKHDDRIIALFIALYAAHDSDTRSIAEDRRQQQEELLSPKKKRPSIQQSGLTYERYYQLYPLDE